MTRSEALSRLVARGVPGPMVYLLDALPLVEMAWADGVVQPAERAMILAFVNQHLALLEAHAGGPVVRRSDALEFINRYLAERPSAETFAELRELMMVVRLTGESDEARAVRILDWVSTVGGAAASPNEPKHAWDKDELLTLWRLEDELRRH